VKVARQEYLVAPFGMGPVESAARADRAQDIKIIKLQALRADLEAVLARYPQRSGFSELEMQGGEQPALWIDACAKVVMEPDPSTYKFVEERGDFTSTRFETRDWYEMREFVTRHVAKTFQMRAQWQAMAAANSAQTRVQSRFERRHAAAWIFGLACGVLVTNYLPIALHSLRVFLQ
jgi:hypothetical protein